MSYNKVLYLDNVSSTKTDSEILNTYTHICKKYFANSSANHRLGREVWRLEQQAKTQILDLLKVSNYNLIFTSGATEANNMAIKSVALANMHRGKHIITSEIEHPSVYESFEFLKKYLGFEVTYIKVDKSGLIDLESLEDSVCDETILVSIMSVNNEIGVINNPSDWIKVVKNKSKAICHVDMVQAIGKIDLDFDGVDLASFSAHKINGVNGSGFLLARKHLDLVPLISGGPQQDKLRAGTPNSPANIVLAKTVRLTLENMLKNNEKLKILNDYLYSELSKIPEISLNSDQINSVYNIINFSVSNVGSEIMMNALSEANIFVSAGSTCHQDLYEDSHVLTAINKDSLSQKGRIRISLDSSLDISDLEYFIKKIKEIINNYGI